MASNLSDTDGRSSNNITIKRSLGVSKTVPPKPVESSDENSINSIKVKRSDGLKHDLVTVFKNPIDYFAAKKKPQDIIHTKENNVADHGMIKIHRSDGEHCDIIKVFKGMSDARGESLFVKKSHVTEDFLIKRTSMSKIEIQNVLKNNASRDSINAPIFTAQNYSNAPSSVRVIHMSNTHNHLKKTLKRSFLPDGDILIVSGGFTVNGTIDEYALFDQWLASIKDIYHYRIVVAGLNDVKECGKFFCVYFLM